MSSRHHFPFSRSRRLASFVLVWFALFLGAGVASTVLQPSDLQWVCSATGGAKLLDTGDDDGELVASSAMACPLCASVAVPLPSPIRIVTHVAALSFELAPPAPHLHGAASAAPPPCRGPPRATV